MASRTTSPHAQGQATGNNTFQQGQTAGNIVTFSAPQTDLVPLVTQILTEFRCSISLHVQRQQQRQRRIQLGYDIVRYVWGEFLPFMGFVLKKSNCYKWPVSVDVPVDGGKHERVTFDVEFKDLTQSRLLEIAELSGEGNLSDVEIAREVMSGWAGVEDEDGKELPYSITKRDELLDVPMMASAIAGAYLESKQGAKRKN